MKYHRCVFLQRALEGGVWREEACERRRLVERREEVCVAFYDRSIDAFGDSISFRAYTCNFLDLFVMGFSCLFVG